jgi:hypothetical protein
MTITPLPFGFQHPHPSFTPYPMWFAKYKYSSSPLLQIRPCYWDYYVIRMWPFYYYFNGSPVTLSRALTGLVTSLQHTKQLACVVRLLYGREMHNSERRSIVLQGTQAEETKHKKQLLFNMTNLKHLKEQHLTLCTVIFKCSTTCRVVSSVYTVVGFNFLCTND